MWRAGGWWESDKHLYAAPPEIPQDREAPLEDLAALKQRMADAHPDLGGKEAEFITARTAHKDALRRAGLRKIPKA
ncbi:hypothetical protein ACWCQL_10560 [Streptomyces sp. NPDC002073]